MKYDDSEYLFLNFETDLDNDAAATHIGMYLAWAILRGLGSSQFERPEAVHQISALRSRQTSGGAVLLELCDGKLMSSDLNELGNAFTTAYYDRHFSKDYGRVFEPDFPDTGHPVDDLCGIADTWANFDRLAVVLDKRFAQWQSFHERPLVGAVPTQDAAAPLALEPLAPQSDEELRRRGENGDAEAWFLLGAARLAADAKPDVGAAIEAFRRAAELGHVEASYNLGVAYQNGDSVSKDARLALDWFTRAADAGHGFATFMLAQAYRSGQLLPVDLALSNALSMIAMMRGVIEAKRFGIVAGHPYSDLVVAMQSPGSLRSILEARRNQPPATPHSLGQTEHTLNRNDQEATLSLFELLATGVGAAGVFVLLYFATQLSGSLFRAFACGFGLIGAAGVFRITQRLGDTKPARILQTLAAAFPAIGSFVCLFSLYRWFSRTQ